ncbi:putative ATPase/DNA-binding SARP family transcriptional activator [Agromyces hippuratus]|uniref:Putative ATPase/DNA-binding SARP family transcriptional activator n=1 Tax=Agromyces hippuratus TaxID=286438 RepID=A0A852WXK7_9MICO|nr:BTAD domain-containing putative transcriptional regulator [Agromyces hippuratus]NYG22679.1 putative ATPase/DNA-binding SARP family transcriptional activator [Agromyces hippuratus]
MFNALAERPRVCVLGPVRIEGRDGTLVEPPGSLAKALVAVLAVGPREPGGTVGVETIIDELWGEAPPRNAKAALQTLVSRLRAVAADGLVRFRPGGYALDVTPARLDLSAAAQLAAEAGSDPADAATLDGALSLWRGEPGTDLGGAPIAELLAERSAAVRSALLERRATLRSADGDHDGAAADLRVLLDAAPLDEHLVAAHLRELAASGRRADALAGFAAFRTALADELGASPSAELVALNAELLRTEGPASRTPRLRIGVRAAPNELIGRDDDLDAIEQALSAHRLVTILGPGGLGKTRLAHEIAARSAAPTVVVVELASVRTDDDVTLALASTLGVREASSSQRIADTAIRPDVRARITQQLAERPALLVLDNCEQVVEGAATWTADLLAAVPALRVLATSRSPLAIGAEQVYPLATLAAGEPDAEPGPAARLFIERARAARPAASLPHEVVQRLCDRLDGLPLAIELAAARVRSMSVEQIEARLADRFTLLAGGDRSAPARQRTLAAVIEWSWALLTPAEQAALPRLAWFVDGFGTDAADTVLDTADAAWVLDGLITQSLLAVADDALGLPRYRMLETVREFGQLRLDADERSEVVAAMAGWASEFSRRSLGHVRGPAQLPTFAAIAIEQDNLVAVLRTAIEQRDAPTVTSVFAALGYFWTVRSAHSEILGLSDAVLEATRGTRPDTTHNGAAMLGLILIAGTNFAADTPVGLRALARLRAVAKLGLPRAPWIDAITQFLLAMPDLERAGSLISSMTESDDPETALLANILQSQFTENEGETGLAAEYALRTHRLAEQVGDAWASAMSALMLAELAGQRGASDEALEWATEARAGMVRLEATQDLLQIDWMVTSHLISAGRLDEAEERLVLQAADDRVTGDGIPQAMTAMLGLVEVARLRGDTALALERAPAVLSKFTQPRQRSSPWYQIALAALVSGGVQSDWPEARVAEWAELMRRRTVAALRGRGDVFTDRPVLGTVTAGWSAWAVRHPSLSDRAVESFAIAEVLHSRQDLPALRLENIAAVITDHAGAEPLAAARAAASVLSNTERTERARALIAEPVPRV